MDFSTWTFTAIGVWISYTALLFNLFQYFNKRRKPKILVVRKSVLLGTIMSLVLYIIGLFAWVKSEIPLSPDEKQTYRNTVVNMVGRFRLYPIEQGSKAKNDLENLIREVQKNPSYEKEMPQETAILYRLYGASIVLSAMSSDIQESFWPYLEWAFSYEEKSLNLDSSIWKKPHEKSSYDFLENLSIEKTNPQGKELLFSIFTIAMVTADESDVRSVVDSFLGDVGKIKEDPEFKERQHVLNCFLNHKSTVEETNVGQVIAMSKSLLGVKFGDFAVHRTGDDTYELGLSMTNAKGITYDLRYEVNLLDSCRVKPLNDPAKSLVPEY